MQTVTNDFETAIDADTRDIRAKVIIDWVGNYISGDATASSSGEKDATNTPDDQAINGKMNPYRKWALADIATADGNHYACPANGSREMGWHNDVKSNGSKEFTVDPWVQVDFDSAKTVGNIVVAFERLIDHYAEDYEVEYYDGSWHTLQTVTGNTETLIESVISPVKTNVTKLKLTISKVSLVSSYAKVIEFGGGYSEEYSVDNIDMLRILKERQFTEGSLPIGNASANSVDLILDNTNNDFFPLNQSSPYYGFFRDNRRIHVYLGIVLPDTSTEWLKQGVFYSGDWRCPDNSPTASVFAMDRAKLLMQSLFSVSDVYEDQTISYLVEQILVDAGLDVSEYEIDTISTTIPYAWFEPVTHWEALKKLAASCSAFMYFDEDGVFKFEKKEHLADHAASEATISDTVNLFSADNPWNYSEVKNHIQVASKPLTTDSEQEVYNMEDDSFEIAPSATKSMMLYFSKKPCVSVQTPDITYSGGTVVVDSWTDYAWGGTLVLENTGGGTATVTEITVDATPLINKGETIAIAEDATLIAEQGTKKYSLANDFIQGQVYAQALADYLLTTYKAPEKDVHVSCRGNFALQLGDRITIENSKNSIDADYWILKDELFFDGSLVSKILGRKAS